MVWLAPNDAQQSADHRPAPCVRQRAGRCRPQHARALDGHRNWSPRRRSFDRPATADRPSALRRITTSVGDVASRGSPVVCNSENDEGGNSFDIRLCVSTDLFLKRRERGGRREKASDCLLSVTSAFLLLRILGRCHRRREVQAQEQLGKASRSLELRVSTDLFLKRRERGGHRENASDCLLSAISAPSAFLL